MTFVKGRSGNVKGMAPGTLHHKTRVQISRAQKLLEAIENHKNFPKMLDDLTGKEMAQLYISALEFLESRKARTEVTDGDGQPLVITVRHSIDNPNSLPTPASQSAGSITEDTYNYQILTDEQTD